MQSHKDDKGTRISGVRGEAEGAGSCLAWKTEGLGSLTSVCKLWEGLKKAGTRLFSVVPSDGTEGNGHALKCMKFHLNTETLLYCVAKHWNRLTREGAKSPSEEMLRARLDRVVGSLLYLAVLEHRGWAQSQEVP